MASRLAHPGYARESARHQLSPKLQSADVKRMAQRMKDDQQREIREYEQKASKS